MLMGLQSRFREATAECGLGIGSSNYREAEGTLRTQAGLLAWAEAQGSLVEEITSLLILQVKRTQTRQRQGEWEVEVGQLWPEGPTLQNREKRNHTCPGQA